MIRLTNALSAWGKPDFESVLKNEIEGLGAENLPLQLGLSTGSHVTDGKVDVMIIGVSDHASVIRAKAGIFYSSIIAGCSCADDPTPVDEHTEYCEVQIDLDKITAETKVMVLAE